MKRKIILKEIVKITAATLVFFVAFESLLFGFPAVAFVATGYIGGRSTFDGGVEPEEPMCDWDDLLELQRQGVSVQSHGVLHRGFSALGPAERE
jgi:hypothetical protein